MDTSQARGVLAAVDCTKQKSLAKKFEIGGFPTRKYSVDMTVRVRTWVPNVFGNTFSRFALLDLSHDDLSCWTCAVGPEAV